NIRFQRVACIPQRRVSRFKLSHRARNDHRLNTSQILSRRGDRLLGLLETDLSLAQRYLGVLDPLPSLREELVRGRTYFHTEGRGSGGVTRHERTDSSGDVPRTLLSRDRNSTSVSVRDRPGQYTVDQELEGKIGRASCRGTLRS